jgi:hypothetical protein
MIATPNRAPGASRAPHPTPDRTTNTTPAPQRPRELTEATKLTEASEATKSPSPPPPPLPRGEEMFTRSVNEVRVHDSRNEKTKSHTDQSGKSRSDATAPSPVADGGGGESARRRGSSSATQSTREKTNHAASSPPGRGNDRTKRERGEGPHEQTKARFQQVAQRAHAPEKQTAEPPKPKGSSSAGQPTTNAPQQPNLPDNVTESDLLDAFLDGSFSLPQLCEHFQLDPLQLLAYLESPQTKHLLDTLARIAAIREKTIAAQARVAATHRLAELATWAHTATPAEARAFETARKAAAQLLKAPQSSDTTPSELKPSVPGPQASRAHRSTDPDAPTPQPPRSQTNPPSKPSVSPRRGPTTSRVRARPVEASTACRKNPPARAVDTVRAGILLCASCFRTGPFALLAIFFTFTKKRRARTTRRAIQPHVATRTVISPGTCRSR